MYMYVFKHFSHLQVHTYDTTKMQEIYVDWDCCVCKLNFTSLSVFVTNKTKLIFLIWRFNVFTFYCEISMRV